MGNIHLGGALELNKLTFAYMLNVITNDGSLKVNDSINFNMVVSTLDNKGSIVATNGIIICSHDTADSTIRDTLQLRHY